MNAKRAFLAALATGVCWTTNGTMVQLQQSKGREVVLLREKKQKKIKTQVAVFCKILEKRKIQRALHTRKRKKQKTWTREDPRHVYSKLRVIEYQQGHPIFADRGPGKHGSNGTKRFSSFFPLDLSSR